MTTAWRLVKKARARTAFDGEGARLFGGRWNQPGTSVVYASSNPALAALETFVHMQRAAYGIDYVVFKIDVPKTVRSETAELSTLPSNWRALPAPQETQDFGTRWANGGTTAVLVVPSILVPDGWNVVLNSRHPDFARIVIGKPEPYSFDPRMWK